MSEEVEKYVDKLSGVSTKYKDKLFYSIWAEPELIFISYRGNMPVNVMKDNEQNSNTF